MRLCLLSYDTPHLKTAQVYMGLYNRGIRSIDLLLTPFSRRPERDVAIHHRPKQFEGPDPRSLASLGGGSVLKYDQWRESIDRYDYFLVCGSNILEPDFAKCRKILNVHAGLIPSVRGLDSFKWAIYEGRPLGNTLHVIDESTDAGEIKYHLQTPAFLEDDIKSLAQRHYDNEIWMLTNFDTLLASPSLQQLEEHSPTKRMSIGTEREMLRRFPAYLTKLTCGSSV